MCSKTLNMVRANQNGNGDNNALANRVDDEFGLTNGFRHRTNKGASGMGRENNCVAKNRC
jgi:hypothetical protein